jgi:hypothetical protein
VVPLEDLVQDDAIDKTTQAEPVQEARNPRGRSIDGACWRSHSHTLLPAKPAANQID